MGDEKKRTSFIVMFDWKRFLDKMTDEQAGVFIKAVFDYQIAGTEYTGTDARVEMAFVAVKPFLDDSAARYEQRCERNRQNGRKGGRPLKDQAETAQDDFSDNPENPMGYLGFSDNPQEPTETLAKSKSKTKSEYKGKGEKEKRDLAACVNAYERVSQMPITPSIGNQLSRFLLVMDADTVQAAITEAQDAGKASWRYMSAILTDWHNAGVKDAQTLSQYRERRRNNAADRRQSTAEAEHARYLARYAEKPTLLGIQLLG